MSFQNFLIHLLQIALSNSNWNWQRSHLPSLYFPFDMIGAWRQRQEGWWRSVVFCWIYILIMPKTSSYIIIFWHVSSSVSYDIYMISLSSVLLLPPLQQLNVLFRSFVRSDFSRQTHVRAMAVSISSSSSIRDAFITITYLIYHFHERE